MVGSQRGLGKLRGVFTGIVTNNTPPDGGGPSAYAVKVSFPWLPDQEGESYWARIVVPMAGAERGTYFLPEIDDQVLVVFEHGDISRPIVIGAMWSQKQPPPEKNKNGKNNLRMIKSKSGHRLVLDDTDGKERIILVDSTGKNKVVFDSAKKAITIQSQDGDITLSAPSGAVRLHANDVKVTSQAAITMKGSAKLQVATKGDLGAKGGSELSLKGAMVQLNPDGFG